MTTHSTREPDDSDFAQVKAERDLLRFLLTLGDADALELVLERVIGLVARVAAARCGYLTVNAARAELPPLEASAVRGLSPEEATDVKTTISSGIIAAAIESGRSIHTAEACSDPRFGERRSVRENRINAVLCVPFVGAAFRGAIYVQGRDAPGPFPDAVRTGVEATARVLSPLVDRAVLRRLAIDGPDATAAHRTGFEAPDLVGRSAALARVLRDARVLAPVDVNVLITGPTGTGKSALARAICANSRRRDRPFVELNCAAIPETLVEQELFGAEAGAHSTATRRIPGKIEAAQGGTIFLDEIGEMPAASQSKLLQFVEDKCFYPLGGSEPVRADVRVIAATNVEVGAAMRSGRLRSDLVYRLESLPLRMPTLSERRDDVPLIAREICRRLAAEFGHRDLRLGTAAAIRLWCDDWPGNVRELAQKVRAGVLRATAVGAVEISCAHIYGDDAASDHLPTLDEMQLQLERRVLQESLVLTRWDVEATARALGKSRATVYERIRAHGLQRPSDAGHVQ